MGIRSKRAATSPRVCSCRSRILEKEGYEFEAAEASFELLIRKALKTYEPLFELDEYRCMFHRIRPHDDEAGFEACTGIVKLSVGGETQYTAADGDGPINALDGALRKALKPFYPEIDNIALTDYRVRISDSQLGSAAKTRVLIDSSDGDHEWSTVGVSFNIIRASWHALVDSGRVLPSAAAVVSFVDALKSFR